MVVFEGWFLEKVIKVEWDGVIIYLLSEYFLYEWLDWVQVCIVEFGLDCIVGVNKDSVVVVVNFVGEFFFWVDINGDLMVEV